MANLKDIRTRIASVSSTKQITSAMKMVSAAKLRKAQDAVTQMRPYALKLHQILSNITSELDSSDGNVFASNREMRRALVVVITSNRGLCGGFNSNVVKRAITIAESKYAHISRMGQLDFVVIGKKGADVLKARKLPIKKDYNKVYEQLTFENVATIAQELMDWYKNGEYDAIELIYNRFKNAATQIVTEEQYLPIVMKKEKNTVNNDYIYEPSKEFIVEQLIPKSLKIQLFKALLDSNAAEHGARMTAMHKATDNAEEMIHELKLTYNKARQTAITNEILEIVGGAEALHK